MKNSFKIEFFKEAKDDLVDIEEYIVNEYSDILTAKKVINRILSCIEDIPSFVYSYPKYENAYLKIDNIYKKSCGNYIILFMVEMSIIKIIGIYSNKRLIKKYITNY